MEDIIEKLKEELGGAKGIADALGDLTPQAVSLWKKVPPKRCVRLEELTGISRHQMRPDFFGPEPKGFKPLKPSKAKRMEATQ
jgi:DNA-binding transcriptional regulator YdaS (Cro superfamily)